MTTLTIILITWFLAGLISNVLIIINQKEDIMVRDILIILLLLMLGYLSLLVTVIALIAKNTTLVIWKYPKKK